MGKRSVTGQVVSPQDITCPVCDKVTQQIHQNDGYSKSRVTNKAPAIFIPYCSSRCYEQRGEVEDK